MFEAKPSDGCSETRPSLPHLFRAKSGRVVLFSREKEGVMLYSGNIDAPITGKIETDWVSCWNTANWEPFKPGETIASLRKIRPAA